MKLLLLPGDGIGPEIADAVESVLEALERVHPIGLSVERGVIGMEALRTDGITVSEATFGRATAADGVILGPVSTADYPPPAQGGLNPSAEFRRRLDLYANIRPSRTRAGVPSLAPTMDLVIVRENTEGFYADRTMHLGPGEFMPTPDLAIAMRKITRQGSERIGRAAAALAAGRRGKLAIVTKSNVLKVTDGLFRNAVQAAARDQAGLEIEEVLVDAMASLLVREPERFDVVVTSNMFGDILSNLAAELAGGLGVAGSLNAGDVCAIAQASHGSAPTLAGRNVANPAALVLSTAMLIGWLGRRDGDEAAVDAAVRLESAVDAALGVAAGRTTDLGGTATTREAATAIATALGRPA
ncbi:MAG: isocitrate/isopropylmalate family dehydrogenase [Thalassobaculum sp.]|uniref:isocitrate/isopropylmalate dehydrogenase family protein n=1 Tax=Thalassobaculum sp. TaxID=2022740 RepID=UPI0032ED2BB8